MPRGIGKLGALKQLTVVGLYELQEMPDLIGLTALGSLTIECCGKVRRLPASIMHLSRLQKLSIDAPLEDMPCIKALTAMRELHLTVAHYADGSCAFTALSRSLPCLQLLQVLRLRAYDMDDNGDDCRYVALQAGDVLAIGSALKAWPMPLLHDVDDHDDYAETSWPGQGLGSSLSSPCA